MRFPITRFSARHLVVLALAVALLAGLGSGFRTPAYAAEAPIGLGTAESFAVLGGTTVTNTSTPTLISGNLGVSPGSSVTGFPPGLVQNGTIYRTTAEAAGARVDLQTAYTDAAGRSPVASGLVELGGMKPAPGVYSGGALGLTGTLTLEGDANSVWVFQASSTLITASSSTVLLSGAVNPCNVFWQVSDSATLGSGSTFVGTVMAQQSITADSGATVAGRLLAHNGAVTLDNNVVTRPTGCATSGVDDGSSTLAPPASAIPGRATFTG